MGNTRTLDLLFMIKRDLYRFHLTSPDTTVVFSEIVPTWLSSPLHRVMEKMRNGVNQAMAKPLLGFAYRHVDL